MNVNRPATRIARMSTKGVPQGGAEVLERLEWSPTNSGKFNSFFNAQLPATRRNETHRFSAGVELLIRVFGAGIQIPCAWLKDLRWQGSLELEPCFLPE